jgi:prepilin-type N-terminal cleavage/methylation domain-containing protein
MRKSPKQRFSPSQMSGFTLMEVMVGLIIGTIMVGGVMGLISVSLQYQQRLNERSHVQPILEAAAQEILSKPEKALERNMTVDAFPDAPPIEVLIAEVPGTDGRPLENDAGKLFRVQLQLLGQLLEFSIIIPEPET